VNQNWNWTIVILFRSRNRIQTKEVKSMEDNCNFSKVLTHTFKKFKFTVQSTLHNDFLFQRFFGTHTLSPLHPLQKWPLDKVLVKLWEQTHYPEVRMSQRFLTDWKIFRWSLFEKLLIISVCSFQHGNILNKSDDQKLDPFSSRFLFQILSWLIFLIHLWSAIRLRNINTAK